jgi:myo-inositol 2-dehydrogenase / D-chiro-inositol 1-dehydrogenase
MEKDFSRRQFIGIGAAAAGAAMVIGCQNKKFSPANMPEFLDQAPEGRELKAGVIGCGSRGTGAALNFLDAGSGLKITHLADVFSDRLQSCKEELKKRHKIEIPESNQFIGFDAYKNVLDSDVDMVILATPPYFRPEHFAAAIEAKKHVFMEKPIAVDPVGIRSVMSTAKRATALDLSVVTGTQRRHQRTYNSTYAQIANGAIGDIVSANCYWNQSQLWYRTKKSGWTEMEYMIRDWVNWCWLSGDHIVEQHVHNLDVIHWYTGKYPIKAVGFGSRQRRVTGDQFDNFSVDYVYEDRMHMHSMSRQINGCVDNVSEWVVGTKGVSNCRDTIKDFNGNSIWEFPYEKNDAGEPIRRETVSPYVQEHIDLVTAIRMNKPFNEAENTAKSNMVAIMGRISAYTGKEVTWGEMMSSDLEMGPNELKWGPVAIDKSIPVPGTEKAKK